jgi:hypothetical protein
LDIATWCVIGTLIKQVFIVQPATSLRAIIEKWPMGAFDDEPW